ncbi:hypothetical protein SAMN05216184_11196 [Georgenia satyanarayanai]|uniref:Uncharacterized protein n=1 Tax=Georgenia satyanarayanai TaxID=860221 RepID=A0A2Y9AM75_9MICO|nr:hypothetical protein [Georgenia satyanarayanai]PYF98439.1 hypothetical protein A8987_11196 [Georgenia satyanarayanai]SSA45106.1 hypothetical protein SAMN05216184_11196 [Georgenia satyanarayanai]
MGFLRKAIRGGIAMKALQIVQREAGKPENQRKAKEMVAKVRNGRKQR